MIIVCGSLVFFIVTFIISSSSSSLGLSRTMHNGQQLASLNSCCLNTKQLSSEFGYHPQLIEDLVRDQQISIVLPVHEADRNLIANLLRSMRNLCIGCTEVPVIVITDDKSKEAIYKTLYNDTSLWQGEPVIAQSFPKLSIKLLREVLPYYTINGWTDESHLMNGKYQIQSHKKMFGILNGASTRFSWILDVDSFIFKPMVLKKFLRDYLSSPYIITSHNWPVWPSLIPCAQKLTGSFLHTGYTIEIMHWIYDREIVSDFNDVVLAKYPNWNVPIFKDHVYFFELTYYHFLISSQIQQRKYMQYKVIEARTLLGGDESPLLKAVAESAKGGLVERIGNSMSNVPSIYKQIVDIWNKLHIQVFNPTGNALIVLDFALDTEVVVLTNEFREDFYRMSQSGIWKNMTYALDNAEKQGWKSLADHLRSKIDPMKPLAT